MTVIFKLDTIEKEGKEIYYILIGAKLNIGRYAYWPMPPANEKGNSVTDYIKENTTDSMLELLRMEYTEKKDAKRALNKFTTAWDAVLGVSEFNWEMNVPVLDPELAKILKNRIQ